MGNFRLLSASILASVAESGKVLYSASMVGYAYLSSTFG